MNSGSENRANPMPSRKKKDVAKMRGSASRFSCWCRPGLTNVHACQKMIGADPTRPTTSAIVRPVVKAPAGWVKKRPLFSRPARMMSAVRIFCQKTNAMMVAANQPIAEMMRQRRRSSRCSTIDMRPSALCFSEDDERRPLVSRAIGELLARLLGFGLGLGGRGRRGRRGRRRGFRRRRRRVLLVHRRPHLGRDVVGGLAELANPASDGPAQLGQLAWPEDDE